MNPKDENFIIDVYDVEREHQRMLNEIKALK